MFWKKDERIYEIERDQQDQISNLLRRIERLEYENKMQDIQKIAAYKVMGYSNPISYPESYLIKDISIKDVVMKLMSHLGLEITYQKATVEDFAIEKIVKKPKK
jgi:hypothetical protein